MSHVKVFVLGNWAVMSFTEMVNAIGTEGLRGNRDNPPNSCETENEVVSHDCSNKLLKMNGLKQYKPSLFIILEIRHQKSESLSPIQTVLPSPEALEETLFLNFPGSHG